MEGRLLLKTPETKETPRLKQSVEQDAQDLSLKLHVPKQLLKSWGQQERDILQ